MPQDSETESRLQEYLVKVMDQPSEVDKSICANSRVVAEGVGVLIKKNRSRGATESSGGAGVLGGSQTINNVAVIVIDVPCN